jgi:glutamate-5-semialdehyde dehydrogenase
LSPLDIITPKINVRKKMSLTNSSPEDVAKSASIASLTLARLSVNDRNHALNQIHVALRDSKAEILEANAKDLALAAEAAQNGQLSQSLVKRLDLGKKGKFEDMLQGILDVQALDDPGI